MEWNGMNYSECMCISLSISSSFSMNLQFSMKCRYRRAVYRAIRRYCQVPTSFISSNRMKCVEIEIIAQRIRTTPLSMLLQPDSIFNHDNHIWANSTGSIDVFASSTNDTFLQTMMSLSLCIMVTVFMSCVYVCVCFLQMKNSSTKSD